MVVVRPPEKIPRPPSAQSSAFTALAGPGGGRAFGLTAFSSCQWPTPRPSAALASASSVGHWPGRSARALPPLPPPPPHPALPPAAGRRAAAAPPPPCAADAAAGAPRAQVRARRPSHPPRPPPPPHPPAAAAVARWRCARAPAAPPPAPRRERDEAGAELHGWQVAQAGGTRAATSCAKISSESQGEKTHPTDAQQATGHARQEGGRGLAMENTAVGASQDEHTAMHPCGTSSRTAGSLMLLRQPDYPEATLLGFTYPYVVEISWR